MKNLKNILFLKLFETPLAFNPKPKSQSLIRDIQKNLWSKLGLRIKQQPPFPPSCDTQKDFDAFKAISSMLFIHTRPLVPNPNIIGRRLFWTAGLSQPPLHRGAFFI